MAQLQCLSWLSVGGPTTKNFHLKTNLKNFILIQNHKNNLEPSVDSFFFTHAVEIENIPRKIRVKKTRNAHCLFVLSDLSSKRECHRKNSREIRKFKNLSKFKYFWAMSIGIFIQIFGKVGREVNNRDDGQPCFKPHRAALRFFLFGFISFSIVTKK